MAERVVVSAERVRADLWASPAPLSAFLARPEDDVYLSPWAVARVGMHVRVPPRRQVSRGRVDTGRLGMPRADGANITVSSSTLVRVEIVEVGGHAAIRSFQTDLASFAHEQLLASRACRE